MTEGMPGMWLLAQSADRYGIVEAPINWTATAIVAACCLLALGAFDFLTKAGIIARATTKEAVRQPVFWLCFGLAVVLLVVNTFLPFFSLGDDVKMLKDCGLATLLISSLLISVWTASTSVADEIEGKTAMTLLSKPVNRRQFILGKYIGIVQAVLWYMLPLSLMFLALIYYKVGYDARELGGDPPTADDRWNAMVQVVPGLLLMFMEVAVLAAVSVAISTRLPMVVNLTTCLAVFVVGHLTSVLVESSAIKNEFVAFMARLIATVFPSLDSFNINAAVATNKIPPPEYLGQAGLYCLCYCAASILMAFILFEDRDLA